MCRPALHVPLASDATLYAQAAGGFLATIIFCQIGNVLACRTARQSAVPGLRRLNKWILVGIAVEVSFILLIVYVPVFQPVFTTAPLPLWVWALILPAPLVIFAVEELRKWVLRYLVISTRR